MTEQELKILYYLYQEASRKALHDFSGKLQVSQFYISKVKDDPSSLDQNMIEKLSTSQAGFIDILNNFKTFANEFNQDQAEPKGMKTIVDRSFLLLRTLERKLTQNLKFESLVTENAGKYNYYSSLIKIYAHLDFLVNMINFLGEESEKTLEVNVKGDKLTISITNLNLNESDYNSFINEFESDIKYSDIKTFLFGHVCKIEEFTASTFNENDGKICFSYSVSFEEL